MVPRYELLQVPQGPDTAATLRKLARGGRGARGGAQYVSRSYRRPLALVAWHSTPVGVDIERVEPLGREFAESICMPQERADLGERLDDDALVASLWSGKEALAKALGDAVEYDPRRLGSPLLWEDGVCGRWRATAVEVPAGHVGWMVWQA